MKKIEIEKVKEYLYYERLDNGLEVYMVPKDTVDNYYVSFTTNFGGSDVEFVPANSNKMKKFPYGIAHFLEHKMFEQENGIDPMLFYAQSGTDCNASTDYYNTSYLFYGENEFEKNLEYLLDYVQSPYYTDENVEKEKGIIEQEIKMYDDLPDRIIFENILFNMFKVDPIRYSIAGKVCDIRSITKELLYECYNTFYNPSNMFLTITGKFDVNSTLEIIKKNQSKKKFETIGKIKRKEYNEPEEVFKEYEERNMKLEIPYIAFGIKIPKKNINMPEIKKNLYFSIIFQYLFSETSDFYENVVKEGIVNTNIDIDMIHTKDYKSIILVTKTKRYKELIDKIKDRLKEIKVPSEFLERKKKVFISSFVYLMEDVDNLNRNISDNITIYGTYYVDMYSIINSLNMKELNTFIKQLNLNNISIYVIK